MRGNDFFSVLICTYNRHEMLAQALEHLTRHASEKPDQIVVVNGGDERADRVVQSFVASQAGAGGVEVALVKTVNKNLAISRNIGLPLCRGDIVAMTDDDAEVFPDWVTRMKLAHREHPEAGAVGGPVLGGNLDSAVGQAAELITFPRWQEARYVRTLPGVNISYKREVIDRIGPQDERLFRGEDVDYNWRVKQAGYEVYFDPGIKVIHRHRATLRGLLRQHYMYGRAYYLVRRKWPGMYCIYPHGIRRSRDVLKAVNVIAAAIYQPIVAAWRVPGLQARLSCLPPLFLAGLSWRMGMLNEACRGWTSGQRVEAANAT